MRKILATFVLVCALGGIAICSNASKIQTVSINSGDLTTGDQIVPGYLALPSGKGRHPAIIVFHENWGIRDWVKLQIRNLAAQGYVVLAIDLYHGKIPKDEAEGEEMSRTLSRAQAYRDSEAAFDYLAKRGDVDPSHIGAIGWAMGGRYAIQLAVHEARLAACVDNYGQFPVDLPEIEKIQASVLVILGAADQEFASDKVHALEEAMKAGGKSLEVKVYDNASHQFLDPYLPNRDTEGHSLYRFEAAQDASKRINAFFAKTLKLSKGD